MTMNLKIGELAARTGCQVETIRYYERETLLSPPNRSSGNYRLYDEEHVERLFFIRHCRSLDLALEEIRTLLKLRDAPETGCGEVNVLLDEHLRDVASKITALKALQEQLKQLRQLCDEVQASKHCEILKELAAQTSAPLKRPATKLQTSRTRKRRKP